MCGRYSLFTPPDRVESRFDAAFVEPFEPTYNAAPGQSLPVVTNEDPGAIRRFEWGLVPSWAEDRSDFEFINARAETVARKRSFAEAYECRRCLVPADGFYEWVQREGGKQPYRVAVGDDELFAMAGLWERWEPPGTQTGLGDFGGSGTPATDPDPVETFTVVTTEPNDLVADLHHRMAVVLDPDEEETWLAGDTAEVADLLDPYPADRMRAYPVSTAVNSPANDSPALVEEVEVGS
ncbi:MAG: SOS response-associated peptidase [Haloarculaceae archaeon]